MAQMSDGRRHELESISNKNGLVAILLGLLISPLGYVYLGKWGLAVINFLTLNYLLTGFVLVPIHCALIMKKAKKELSAADADE